MQADLVRIIEELQQQMAMEMGLWGSMQREEGKAEMHEYFMETEYVPMGEEPYLVDPDTVKMEAEKVLSNCYEHIAGPFNDALRAITGLHQREITNLTKPKIVKP